MGEMIDEKNRKLFIADGDMYEHIARLCQEYAHEVMCEEANLEWCTVEPVGDDKGSNSVCVLVNKEHPIANTQNISEGNNTITRPTLVITTGRGKVRAGIFSRKHLICGGLESSTALPMIREALARNLHVLIPDPNVHGDAHGFVVFQKTLDHYFERLKMCATESELYILSHSASGGHLARYFLDRSSYHLSQIKAIAFTDSPHNIQLAAPKKATTSSKQNKSASAVLASLSQTPLQNQTGGAWDDRLYRMLESDQCVYFRCSNIRGDESQWYVHPAGELAQTDSFWKHL